MHPTALTIKFNAFIYSFALYRLSVFGFLFCFSFAESEIVEIQSDKNHRKCMTTNNLDNRVRVYNMIHDSQPIASVKNKSHKIKCISNVGSSQTSIFGAIISNTWRGMVCAQCMFSFFAYVSREILSKFYIYVQYIDRYFDGWILIYLWDCKENRLLFSQIASRLFCVGWMWRKTNVVLIKIN